MEWDGTAWVFLSLILARRWTGIITVMASALADLTEHRMGLSRLKALLVGSDIGRLTCILLCLMQKPIKGVF
jgi:hypothetical protein